MFALPVHVMNPWLTISHVYFQVTIPTLQERCSQFFGKTLARVYDILSVSLGVMHDILTTFQSNSATSKRSLAEEVIPPLLLTW